MMLCLSKQLHFTAIALSPISFAILLAASTLISNRATFAPHSASAFANSPQIIPLLSALQSLIEEHENQKYASQVATKLKIMELLVEILRSDSPPVEKAPHTQAAALIYNTMVYVRNHYAEDMDERELARSLGMSYSYFSRSFRRVTGMTFKQYLNRTRVNQAEKMLCRGTTSVSEVATKCGYNSISYFISVYKNITGKTPYQSLQQTEGRQKAQ